MANQDMFEESKEGVKKEVKVLQGEESKDRSYASSKSYKDVQQASSYFEEAKAKLFYVNAWSHIQAFGTASFELYEANGNQSSDRKVMVGDYIRIALPGPFPENWVQVIDLQEQETVAEFTVSPANDPTSKNKDKVEHFFTAKATSTFRVELIANQIIAKEIGKQEQINNDNQSAGRALINTLIAAGGWAGFQYHQWKNLTEYLVDEGQKREIQSS